MARWDAQIDEREGELRRRTVFERLGGKTSKEMANYRPSHESESGASCGECEHYLVPGNPTSPCRRVAGNVEARDVCDMFASRTSEFGGQGQESPVQPSQQQGNM